MSNSAEHVPFSVANVQFFSWKLELFDATRQTRLDRALVLAFRFKNYEHDETENEASSYSHRDSFETYVTEQLVRFSEHGVVSEVLEEALGSVTEFFGRTRRALASQISQYLSSNFYFGCLEYQFPSRSVLVLVVDIITRRSQYPTSCFSKNKDDIARSLRESLMAQKIFVKPAKGVELEPLVPGTISEIIEGYGKDEDEEEEEEEEEDVCCICLEGYSKSEEVAFRTVCNHIFHGKCIKQACLNKSTCPLCRSNLPVLCVVHMTHIMPLP